MENGDNFEAELTRKVGALKRAAIDAAIAGGAFNRFTVGKDSYEMTAMMSGTTKLLYKVTRPDENGSGGGEMTITEDPGGNRPAYDAMARSQSEKIKARFDSIRKEIDDIIKPWKTLPDPSAIANDCDAYAANVTAQLASSAEQIKIPDTKTLPEPNPDTSSVDTSSATYRPPGPMGTRLSISRPMNELKGSAMDTFSKTFQDKLPLIVKDLCYVSGIHCCTLAAEYGFFKKAREKVIEMVTSATDTFNKIAKTKKSVDSTMLLNVISWGLSILALPWGGGTSLAAATGVLALTIVKDTTSAPPERKTSVSSYEDMKKELEESFKALKEELKKGEEAVSSTLKENHTRARDDKKADFESASLHLVPSPIVSGANELQMDDDNVNKVSTQLLSVADLLEEAAAGIGKIPMRVHRDGFIGLGENGPSSEYDSFGQMLHELLLDLKWQIEEGVINLKLALNDFKEQDESSRAALEDNASAIKAGSGVDPWDDKRQTEKDMHRDPYFADRDDHDPHTPTQDPSRQELGEEMKRRKDEGRPSKPKVINNC